MPPTGSGGDAGGRRPDPILEIVPYDPRWPAQFERERALLAQVLPSAITIEHFGSTSVPGMSAKPTLDILVVLAVASEAPARTEQLAAIGYDYMPRSFPDDTEHLFFRKVVGGRRKAHLHVLGADSPKPAEYRLFRDFLVARPGMAARYEVEKLALAAVVGYDRTAYVTAKERIVEELMKDAHTWRPRAHDAPG